MRILTVTHFFEAHGGGIERVASHLCRQFALQGHQPVWAASSEDIAPKTVEAVPLRCLNIFERLTGLPMPIPSPGAMGRLWHAVAEADAVVIHDALYVTSIVGLLVARWRRRPVLLIQHVADIPFSNAILRGAMRVANRLVTRPMLRAADQVVFISATTRQAFADVPNLRPPLLAFNGVDCDIFKPVPDEDRAEVRRAHHLPTDRKVVLFVGRFVAKKGLAVLTILARDRPDLEFALVGKGPIDPARWNLPNVTVRGGLGASDLAALYRAADLLVLPSVGEGYPLVVQEAMACGLPILCGDETARADPGAGTWLTGVRVDLARPHATAARFSAAIDAKIVSSNARAEMAAYAAKTYSWAKMASSIINALNSVS